MKKIFTLFLFASASLIFADDIEVSQDTLLQNLNYGESADRTITITNNTSSDVELLYNTLALFAGSVNKGELSA